MGCCLTKKSRENRIKRDKSPLLNDNKSQLEQRGVSLSYEKNGLEHLPSTAGSLQHTQSITSQDPSREDGYEPPNHQQFMMNKAVIGKSLLEPPSVDALNKAEMIEKRGHLVLLIPIPRSPHRLPFPSLFLVSLDSQLEEEIRCLA
jgi:hypothetical protein